MAERSLIWNFIGKVLNLKIKDTNISNDFDLSLFFPEVEDMNNTQRYFVEYAFKQFLADKVARGKDETLTNEEKVKVMVERFNLALSGEVKKASKLTGARIAVKAVEEKAKKRGLSAKEKALLQELGIEINID
jgi:hypothetical protein